jgi:hypothetical protein
MGHETEGRHKATAALTGLLTITTFFLFALSSTALAVPFHPRSESLDLTGLNHACGVAVDSKGDLYLSSAGESKVKVYNPSHALLTEITDANTPCGLAVTTTGNLYVSEKGSGEVVRFKPNAYPFVGTPTYGSREVIDSSAKAKGIAVDPVDNRLYVAEGTKVAVYKSDGSFEANVGEGTLSEASGVAAFTYSNGTMTDRYLWVADAATNKLYLFAAAEANALKLRRELNGSNTPSASFGFGAAGAYLAADPGNRIGEKCVAISEQGCDAGHVFLYDAAHKALDEFDASGEFLDQTKNASFADAEPTAVAIDRSGGTNDGTLYVTAGAGTGAKALAFGPLKQPSRKTLKKPSEEAGGLSQELAGARAVATDPYGDVYALAGSVVHVYGPKGEAITTFEDTATPREIAVDSACNVYLLDLEAAFTEEEEPKPIAGVDRYGASKCAPKAGTTFSQEGTIVTAAEFLKGTPLRAIAVNPGPGKGKDQLFVLGNSITRLYKSAAEGSEQLDEDFGAGLVENVGPHLAIAVNGSNGNVYITVNGNGVYALNGAGTELLAHFDTKGSPSGKFTTQITPAVDQSNGHVIDFDKTSTVREYDAAGSFVTEYGNFTEGLSSPDRLAVDNSCAIQKLTGQACEEFDPANGTVYLAWDDTNPSHPPYDVTAFGPLSYSEPPQHKLTVKKEGSGSGVVTSEPAGIDCGSTCSHEFPETEVVKLTAKADPENEFESWTGCEAQEAISGTESICEVTMDNVRDVVVRFKTTKTLKLLKVVVNGSGHVTGPGIDCPGDCKEEFGLDVEVTLNAAAASGAEFIEWKGGDCESVKTTTCTVTMDQDEEITSEFGIEHPLLTVAEKGGGTGIVTSEDGFIKCPPTPTCTHKYDLGDKVTLTAKPDPGSTFIGWHEEDCDNEPPPAEKCEVTMDEPREETAFFATLPGVIAKSAQPILYTEATLRGEVNPAGSPTEYQFEYLTEEEFEANGKTFEEAQPTPAGKLKAGSGFVTVEAILTGLEEGTTYRFRLRAMNSVGPAEDEGSSFATLERRAPQTCSNTEFRFGLSAGLPDCRAYELVTPAQTNGLVPEAATSGTSPSGTFNDWLTPQRGEAGGVGERLSYFTNGTLPGFEGNGVFDGYLAKRGEGEHPSGGWQSVLFGPNYAEAAPGLKGSPFRLGVSTDQSYSVWEINPEPETFAETLPHGIYLRTPTGFEVMATGSLGKEDLEPLSRYVSPGGSHVIFASAKHLEEAAAPEGTMAVYDREAGSISAEVISVKPDGSSFGGGENASYAGANEAGAAVAFNVSGVLYVHREGQTVEVAKAPNAFAGISESGLRVFYAKTTEGADPAALYVCDLEAGPCAGPGSHPADEIASNGIFTLVSPDGSHAFFSSTQALTGGEENDNGEEAEAGEDNLYAWNGVETHFIGRLSGVDFQSAAFGSPSALNLGAWTLAVAPGSSSQSGRALAPTRSTPDGSAFVFQSHARLTEYDNEGRGEIYRYDPAAEAGERLLCVSCDPSGAPPTANALLEDVRSAAGIPLDPATMISSITDSGKKVFFQSFDRLLPEDANEAEDVYEWRANGTVGPGGDTCAHPAGCLALISSGQGESPSFLYSMSADGHDVFLQTREKLVGADSAGSPSIYDAREGGGIPEPFVPSPCQGDDCQGNGTSPPGIPAAATTGQGEAPVGASSAGCPKGKHKVKGRCVATKKPKKHRKHAKHRRRRAHANRGGSR